MPDVVTLLVLLAVTSGVLCLCVTAALVGRMRDGQAAWCWALGLQAAGWGLFALPLGEGQDGLIIVGGTACLTASLATYAHALFVFSRQRSPRFWLVLAPLAVAVQHAWFIDAFVARGLVSNLAGGLLLLLAAWPLWRHATDVPAHMRRALAVALVLAALATLARAAELLLAPERLPDLRTDNPVSGIGFLVNLGCLVFINLGIALMHQARARAEADRLATRDPLTELLHRRSFVTLGSREILRAERSGSPVAVLVMDIDGFGAINNSFGHLAGDRVLRHLAELLRATLRGQDVATRMASDEFCVLLPDTGLDGARLLGERLRQTVAAARVEPDGVRYRISVGAAERLAGESDPLGALARASAVLQAGRAEPAA